VVLHHKYGEFCEEYTRWQKQGCPFPYPALGFALQPLRRHAIAALDSMEINDEEERPEDAVSEHLATIGVRKAAEILVLHAADKFGRIARDVFEYALSGAEPDVQGALAIFSSSFLSDLERSSELQTLQHVCSHRLIAISPSIPEATYETKVKWTVDFKSPDIRDEFVSQFEKMERHEVLNIFNRLTRVDGFEGAAGAAFEFIAIEALCRPHLLHLLYPMNVGKGGTTVMETTIVGEGDQGASAPQQSTPIPQRAIKKRKKGDEKAQVTMADVDEDDDADADAAKKEKKKTTLHPAPKFVFGNRILPQDSVPDTRLEAMPERRGLILFNHDDFDPGNQLPVGFGVGKLFKPTSKNSPFFDCCLYVIQNGQVVLYIFQMTIARHHGGSNSGLPLIRKIVTAIAKLEKISVRAVKVKYVLVSPSTGQWELGKNHVWVMPKSWHESVELVDARGPGYLLAVKLEVGTSFTYFNLYLTRVNRAGNLGRGVAFTNGWKKLRPSCVPEIAFFQSSFAAPTVLLFCILKSAFGTRC
jgi:hypothetical protein